MVILAVSQTLHASQVRSFTHESEILSSCDLIYPMLLVSRKTFSSFLFQRDGGFLIVAQVLGLILSVSISAAAEDDFVPQLA